MKPHSKVCFLFLCVCALLAVLTPAARAFQPPAPGLTVIVGFPADDLELSLRFQDGDAFITVQMYKEQIAWEAQYRWFYTAMAPEERPPLTNVTLIANTNGKTFECPLPASMLSSDDNILLSLDVSRRAVTPGKSVGRGVSLVSIRVLLTLLLEGLLFFIFGYRKKCSWVAFLIVNLITQGTLNIVMNQYPIDSYIWLILIPLQVLGLLVELATLAAIINEHRRLRTVAYVVAANFFSLLLGGLLVALLPL